MADTDAPATATPTIVYERGTEIVDEVSNGTTYHGVRGTITVKGKSYDTLERLDGRVWLRPGTYPAKMEESPSGTKEKGPDGKWRKRRQIRPKHDFKAKDGTGPAPILFHSGSIPSHFEGCIGSGVESPAGLDQAVKTMDEIFDLLGGFKVGTELTVEVKGDLPKVVKVPAGPARLMLPRGCSLKM